MARKQVDFKNPIIAAQTFDFPFVPDPYLGHTMPAGREFLGERDYVSIDRLVEEARHRKKPILLNIGDSSTSGWDSNIVTKNRALHAAGKSLLPAFFQYKTYSDYLRDKLGADYIVVNAGVPAHTSLQGSRRIRLLLKRFQKERLSVARVSIYYGNNDSVWDHNRQDKEWVGRSPLRPLAAFLRSLTGRRVESDRVVTRVAAHDYRENIKDIVKTCRKYRTSPILIEPVTPLYWKPGTRVLNEDLDRAVHPGSDRVYELLDEARALWSPAIGQAAFSDLKIRLLEEAREKDFVVPRIKKAHLAALRSVAEETGTPCIRTYLDRTKDDIRYFIDYCHPIGGANELIAQQLAMIVLGKKVPVAPKKRNIETPVAVKSAIRLPTDHYTLY